MDFYTCALSLAEMDYEKILFQKNVFLKYFTLKPARYFLLNCFMYACVYMNIYK